MTSTRPSLLSLLSLDWALIVPYTQASLSPRSYLSGRGSANWAKPSGLGCPVASLGKDSSCPLLCAEQEHCTWSSGVNLGKGYGHTALPEWGTPPEKCTVRQFQRVGRVYLHEHRDGRAYSTPRLHGAACCYKPAQRVTALNAVGKCNTLVFVYLNTEEVQ